MSPIRIGFLNAILLSACAQAGEVPFGHADWKASPTDPVGFAGQGNNWYPGATPPTTWSHTADGKSQNIRFQVPIPGWTDAQPVVVGKYVVGVYSPHHVVCYDADTGKVLWKDELKLMTLPLIQSVDLNDIDKRGQGRTMIEKAPALKPGQTPGPMPDPAKAIVLQDLFERGLAICRLSQMLFRNKGDMNETNMVSRKPLIAYAFEVLTEWKRALPDHAAALDQDLATLQMALNGDWASYTKAKQIGAFEAAVDRICRTHLQNNWQGSVSDVMASPVSDGEIVGVSLGFGQIAAYELSTGKRLWAWRDVRMVPGSASHCASPCLWKDLLLVPAAGKMEGKQPRSSMLGIDKRTGVVHWETFNLPGGHAWGQKASHGIQGSPHLMRLPGGRPLLVSNMGNLIDPETGASLGQLPDTVGPGHKWDTWAGFVGSANGLVLKSIGVDGSKTPFHCWPLNISADGQLTIGQGFKTVPVDGGHHPAAVTDRLLIGRSTGILDVRTGTRLGALPRGSSTHNVSIAGHYLISARDTQPEGASYANPGNPQHFVGSPPVSQLTVGVYDITDPAKPKKLGDNILTVPGFTPDITAQYFPKAPGLYPTTEMRVCRGYDGIAFFFAETAGLKAHGNRLYVHSPGQLICIGER